MKFSFNNKRFIALICVVSILAVAALSTFSTIQYKRYLSEKALKKSASMAEITNAFHDQGYIYMDPVAPTVKDDVTLRLRCDRYNVTKAHIQYTSDNGANWNSVEMEYEKTDETGYYDIWKGVIPAQSEPYFYRFAIANESKGATMYLGVKGVWSSQLDTDDMFYVIPDFDTPDWSKGTLWYYVHLGQFFNGDSTNDLLREGLLNDSSFGNEKLSMRRSGGDIKGLIEKLDYIESLGVKSIALGPFFSSSESLGFGTDNLAAVETAFGTEEDLKNLIKKVHSRDMRITSELVVSYSTSYSKYFNSQLAFPEAGAYNSKDSKYYSLFKFPEWPNNFVKIWSSVGLDAANPVNAGMFYKDKDSFLLRYLNTPYGLDGYRFDAEESVGNLGYDYDPVALWTDIRKSIKGVSKDVLILSENCVGIADQYNTMYDSSWQKLGYFAMKDWFSGSINENDMIETLQDNLINTARPRALSSYNFIGQHDVSRLWTNIKEQRNEIASLLLLQMTFLGSPVIYYGDEIGLTNGVSGDQKASPFNWDESTWDYDVLNLIKALGSARNKFSCLKDGVIKIGEIDTASAFLSFGRFDENGSVITLCNKQNVPVEQEINVSQYNVKNGKTLTDYFTGKTYKVKDGKVKVTVIPGGTLLTTEKTVSDYKGKFVVNKIGGKADIKQNDTDGFSLSANGKLGSKKDKITLLGNEVYNAGFISTEIDLKSGKSGIMIRENTERSSAYYSAVVLGNRVEVYSRKSNGQAKTKICSVSLSDNKQIKLQRNADNTFVLFMRENSDSDWNEIEKSKTAVDMSEKAIYGIFTLKGKSKFKDIEFMQKDVSICDDFTDNNTSSMLSLSDKKCSSVKDGALIIDSDDNAPQFALSNSKATDWTFKTKISKVNHNKGVSLAGITAFHNKDDYVIAARSKSDGKNLLVFGKIFGGKLQLCATAEDKEPKKDVIIQLQKSNCFYSAVYSYNGEKWYPIGDKFYSNYSGVSAGLFALNSSAQFDYACYGDSINDNKSTNTPMALNEIHTGIDRYLYDYELDKMAYIGDESLWEDIGAGYKYTSDKGTGLLACSNKIFRDFKAEATVVLEKGKGTAGILFGKQSYSSDINDCYKLSLSSDGNLKLLLGDKKLANAKVSIPDKGLRLIVRRENGYIHIFAGLEPKLVISVYDTTHIEGFVSYYAENLSASIINYDITPISSDYILSDVLFGTDNVLEMVNNNAAWLNGVGITKGITSVTLNLQSDKVKEGTDDRLGILLGGNCEQKPLLGGVYIAYSKTSGMLTAYEKTEKLGEYKLAEPNTLDTVKLLVVFDSGKYTVYANNIKTPVLTVEASTPNGGAVALVSSVPKNHFIDFKVTDTTGFTDAQILNITDDWYSTPVYTSYSTDMVKANGKKYIDDFSDYSGWCRNFNRMVGNEANWYIADGMLKVENTAKNWNMATITNGIYKNVDVELKARFSNGASNSIFSLSVGKQEVYAGYTETGYSVNVYKDGRVNVYDANLKKSVNGNSETLSDTSEFFDIKISVRSNTISVFLNGKSIYSGTISGAKSGYIALQADYAAVEVDNISVNPIS